MAELATALDSLSIADLTRYQQAQATELKNRLAGDLATSFTPSLNSAILNSNNYDMVSNYVVQSKNLQDTVSGIASQASTNANIASRNDATATRTREIKEWYYNNKLDTLFVFQLIFISITFLAVIGYAMKAGFIGGGVFGALIGVLVVVNILVIANRAIYTDKVRDKRYWSKRNFTVLGSPLPGGSLEAKCK